MDNASPLNTEAIRAANDFALRPVRSTDGAAMERFVMDLSAASRRLRFHGAVNACGPELLRRLTQADGLRHVAYVACIDGSDGGERIVGEARYVVSGSGSGSAEFAIAVADSHQGSGLADALLRALLRAAGAAGLARLYGDVLDVNARMAGFMRRWQRGPRHVAGHHPSAPSGTPMQRLAA